MATPEAPNARGKPPTDSKAPKKDDMKTGEIGTTKKSEDSAN